MRAEHGSPLCRAAHGIQHPLRAVGLISSRPGNTWGVLPCSRAVNRPAPAGLDMGTRVMKGIAESLLKLANPPMMVPWNRKPATGGATTSILAGLGSPMVCEPPT